MTSISILLRGKSITKTVVMYQHAETWLWRQENDSHLQVFLAVRLILRLAAAVPITTKPECRHLSRLTGPKSQGPPRIQILCIVIRWWSDHKKQMTISEVPNMAAYLAQNDSQHQHYSQTLHHNFCTAQYILPPCPYLCHPADLIKIERWQHSTRTACPFLRKRRLRRHRRVVAATV